jgi:hypothetical protein
VLIEFITHLIQPYPYLNYYWKTGEVMYSINSILFSLCILRLYVCIKVLKYWDLYASDKSKRVHKFFNNDNINVFLYKANLKTRGFFTLVLIVVVCIYLSALILKVYEDFDPNTHSKFNDLLNCLWYLIVTMTTSIFN